MKVRAQKKRRKAPAKNGARSGARRFARGFSFAHYLYLHRESCLKTLKQVLRAPINLCIIWLSVAIALALPAYFYLLIKNFQHLHARVDTKPQISIFLKRTPTASKLELLIARLRQLGLKNVQYTSPARALKQFSTTTQLNALLANLPENPLPPLLSANLSHFDDQRAWQLKNRLENWPEVDQVSVDVLWIKRLGRMLALAKQLVWCVAFLLALGALLAIGNAVRMSIERRREEIIVIKLVGGTDAYIRRPFLYLGAFIGFGAGLFAWFFVSGITLFLSHSVAQLVALYPADFHLYTFSLLDNVRFVLLSVALGWLGALLASQEHLRYIEPK